MLLAAAASLLLSGAAAGETMSGDIYASRSPSPADYGMVAIAPHIYVEPTSPPEKRAKLLNIVEKARVRAEYFYGRLAASPDIAFCASMECYRKFGGIGLGYTDGETVFISPYGARAAIVAHELSHVELAARLGGLREVLDKVPQWFDEGMAVMVSLAHEFSDDAWLEATDYGKKAPPLSELASMEGWIHVTGFDGANMQLSYGTARREVGNWYAKVGRTGFERLIRELKAGEHFSDAYRSIEDSASVVLAAAPH